MATIKKKTPRPEAKNFVKATKSYDKNMKAALKAATKGLKKIKPPAKMGRPTIYTEAMRDEICSRLAEGDSLRKICQDEHIATVGTVCRWLAEFADFSEQYAKAREAQAERMADELLEIADQAPEIHPITGARDGASVQHQRLRIDTRKWVAAKLLPKKYGDKLELGGEVKVGVAEAIREARERAAKR